MGRVEQRTRLIVNADDFGRSRDINAAVQAAHREGILTTASLMVGEPYAEEAVTIARQCPRLGVGLHLTLIHGRATLPATEVPGLANAAGEFKQSPVRTGCDYFFRRDLRDQLRREIHAQFGAFEATGLPLDHVNGHLNLHLHPTVFALLMGEINDRPAAGFRITRDRFRLNARLASGRWAYRISHAIIFALLAARARRPVRQAGWATTENVFGLLQNAEVDEAFVRRLLEVLPPGDSELYCHPSLTDARHEYEALVAAAVRQRVRDRGIELIRYQDLRHG